MKPYYILFLAILITMASCRSSQKISARKCAKAEMKYELASYKWGCPLLTGSDTNTNTHQESSKHDTTILVPVPGDTVHDADTVYVGKNGLVNTSKNRLDTQYAWSMAWVNNGILFHSLYQKPSEIAVTIRDAIQTNSFIETKTITKTITIRTNNLTQWQIGQMWAGRLLLATLFLYFGTMLLKRYLKPL